jgi:hypothetical protein
MRSSLSPSIRGAAALLCAIALSGTAHAQLKAPKNAKAPKAAAAASAPASQPAAEPQVEAVPPEIAAKVQAAGLAAQGWLTLLDRRDWGTAWETAANMFRGAVPLATWMDGIPKVRADLGAFTERDPVTADYKTELPGKPPGDYVTLIFASRFEKRQVDEVVTTVLEPDGKWRVTGYSTR